MPGRKIKLTIEVSEMSRINEEMAIGALCCGLKDINSLQYVGGIKADSTVEFGRQDLEDQHPDLFEGLRVVGQ